MNRNIENYALITELMNEVTCFLSFLADLRSSGLRDGRNFS